ncbi:hypothetical protein AVEN_175914-1, partial [Araneus ventricosus]
PFPHLLTISHPLSSERNVRSKLPLCCRINGVRSIPDRPTSLCSRIPTHVEVLKELSRQNPARVSGSQTITSWQDSRRAERDGCRIVDPVPCIQILP